ncbi:MAG: hypothetical protein ACKO19_06850 [Betaproteobacteria bacterium]|jgi:hypothetical protein
MTLCPIALLATCNKCPVVGVCPLKGVIGDYKPPEPSHSGEETASSGKAPDGTGRP